jgi:hypothetical protein
MRFRGIECRQVRLGNAIGGRSIFLRVSDVLLRMGQMHVADPGPSDEAFLAGIAVGEQAAVVVSSVVTRAGSTGWPTP